MLLLSAGCSTPPQAPRELNLLARYLYREWGNEDPAVMTAGIDQMYSFMKKMDLDSALNDRSFVMKPPTETDFADVDRPAGQSTRDLLGISVSGLSEWPVRDHARLQTVRDQSITEGSAKAYARRANGDGCFVSRGCDVMETENEILRENLLYTIDMISYKDFRWVAFGGGNAIVSRSWTDQVWRSDGKAIKQSNAVEVWIPHKGDTLRMQILWSDSDVGVSDPDLITNTMKLGIEGIFKDGDKAIQALYHCTEPHQGLKRSLLSLDGFRGSIPLHLPKRWLGCSEW